MYRFKTSKYRNATAKIPKKEAWITDITVTSCLTHGNLIKSSAAFVAFLQERPGGGSVDVLPLDFKGKADRNSCALHCHSDFVTDFDFSPFDDGLLATSSQDCTIKLWHIPEHGLQNHIFNPEAIISDNQHRVDSVLFHPTVDALLASSSQNTVKLWNVFKEEEIYSFSNHQDLVQSICFHGTGSLIGTSCKDKKLRILDPRSPSVVQEASSHSNPKDSRIIWLGDSNQILSTGFQSGHERQAVLRDIRSFTSPLKTISFDNCIGILLPFYDSDTKMLFIAGKADASISFLEVTNNDPYLSLASKDLTDGQTKGMCLVPKRALNVMQGEVNRLLQLTQSAIVPITYQVPRKTYRDFHSDLYPDTVGTDPAMSLSEWLEGQDKLPHKISLDPSKRKSESLQKHSGPSLNVSKSEEYTPITPRFRNNSEGEEHDTSENIMTSSMPAAKTFYEENEKNNFSESLHEDKKKSKPNKPLVMPKPNVSPILKRGKSAEIPSSAPMSIPTERPTTPPPRKGSIDSFITERRFSSSTPIQIPKNSVNGTGNGSPKPSWVREMVAAANANPSGDGSSSGSPRSRGGSISESPIPSARRESFTPPVKPFAGFRVSKFRHLKGTPFHKKKHIENIKNLSTSLPRECDGIQGNKERVALSLKGPGGRLTVLELSKTGRIPDGVIPVLQNVANVMDFCWDPFDTRRIAVACDDAVIRLWIIPENGLMESLETPVALLKGHTEKVTVVKFHPLAENILASCSHDLTVRIWDIVMGEARFCLQGHLDQIFSLDWSPDGKYIATVAKDNMIRIYNARMPNPIAKGVGTIGNRGARVKWVLHGNYLITCGFDRVSERQIKLFSIDDLDKPVTTVALDVSPAILVPHYDEDSATLFVTGKGDSTIYAYEVLDESPYLFPLSHHKCATVHQGLAFLPKVIFDVRAVEFARALRLSGTTIEPLSFTVPRVKMDVFQSDIFPDTRVLWEPTLTKDEWLQGKNKEARRLSLKPLGMQESSLDSARNVNSSMQTNFYATPEEKTTKEKEKDLVHAISKKLDVNHRLEQDSMEGVDPEEWDD